MKTGILATQTVLNKDHMNILLYTKKSFYLLYKEYLMVKLT